MAHVRDSEVQGIVMVRRRLVVFSSVGSTHDMIDSALEQWRSVRAESFGWLRTGLSKPGEMALCLSGFARNHEKEHRG